MKPIIRKVGYIKTNGRRTTMIGWHIDGSNGATESYTTKELRRIYVRHHLGKIFGFLRGR
jgi:hypothetical protein